MQTKFQLLDSFLINHQEFWRIDPFHLCQAEQQPWALQSPELKSWLDSLSINDVTQYKEQPERLINHITSFIPELESVAENTFLPLSQSQGLDLDRNTGVGIPGRKLEQILTMGEAALTNHRGTEWLEWCSGKGFLGRVLAQQSQQKVTSFEWQQSLCESGQQIADKQGLNMRFIQGDAFNKDSINVFNSRQHAIALHACGDLHVKLIQHAVAVGLPAISFSPCCYHLIQGDRYQALSLPAQTSALELLKADLRIPLQETVTGGERVKRHRQIEMTFRLGFSRLLKQELGMTGYVPVPSIKKSQLDEGFEAFCQWAAAKKGLTLPSADLEAYETFGESDFWEMEKLSLVQQVFRRPLELWLILDKALFMEEQGYHVNIMEFCDKKVTPRNILLHAYK
ncbi:methyltransferase [Vibrio profundi]|uniref:methyltransferase n=1 Tax=Vibrio profundi TaxID=1774960 RepID=UPI003737108C